MREKAPIPRAREQREELELLKLGTCRRVPVGVTLRPLRSRRYLAGTGVSYVWRKGPWGLAQRGSGGAVGRAGRGGRGWRGVPHPLDGTHTNC